MLRGLASAKQVKGLQVRHNRGAAARGGLRRPQVAEREPLVKPAPLRPDSNGRYGKYGGKYVPETLMYALSVLEQDYARLSADKAFQDELQGLLKDYVGRATPLYFAERLTEHYGGGCEIYLKREDLNHTGAHKINNALGQALMCQKLGKERIIAETGAGQHGVATATVCARGARENPPREFSPPSSSFFFFLAD